jgi:NAD(P)-dependent dehydrogenase (short-subunit alcohol dehydrogenase family)
VRKIVQEFQGKVAVVTGGASGIGKAIARRLAEQGMSIVLADFEQGALEATAKELTQQEFEVLPVFADVRRRESLEALRDETLKRFGAVHVLVNNAGVADSARVPIWESSMEDWDWVFQINFWGVLQGLRTFVPVMLQHGEPGHIVNTASVAGLIAGGGIYGVSKHAVVALTEALFRDLRATDAKLGASVLCPPFVKTKIFESARNRPGVTEVETFSNPEILQRAWEPEAIADEVLAGIREERLYVVPQSEFDPMWQGRFANISARRNPQFMAMPAFQRR